MVDWYKRKFTKLIEFEREKKIDESEKEQKKIYSTIQLPLHAMLNCIHLISFVLLVYERCI